MPDPAKLSFSTSFNQFKNFDRKEVSIAISGTIASGVAGTYSQLIALDRQNAFTSVQFTTSVNSTFYRNDETYLLMPDTYISHDDGSTATFPGSAPYNIRFENSFNGNLVDIKLTVFNENAETLTVVSETVSVRLYTQIAPFAQ